MPPFWLHSRQGLEEEAGGQPIKRQGLEEEAGGQPMNQPMRVSRQMRMRRMGHRRGRIPGIRPPPTIPLPPITLPVPQAPARTTQRPQSPT